MIVHRHPAANPAIGRVKLTQAVRFPLALPTPRRWRLAKGSAGFAGPEARLDGPAATA